MRHYFIIGSFLFPFSSAALQDCLLGKAVPRSALSVKASKNHEARLAEAEKNYRDDSTDADNIIWLGRRWAYLGEYEKAIALFTKGIALYPGDARMYRHRGHRYITLRCFDAAIVDFKKASNLVKRKPDEVEPDGLPNAKNIPTSTLQSNIWYHLGLAYFIKGEYKKALQAYRQCLRVSKNPDMYVATANWMYITLRRLKKDKQAASLLATVKPGMKLIENNDYLQILLLYKQQPNIANPVQFLKSGKEGLGLVSFGYGLGNYLLLNGQKEKATEVYCLITESNQWFSFGYIAAEAELKRMK
jgi:tetratricopeptide (TPR) repeat protein